MNNACIAELLARAAEEVKTPTAAKALRKASRRALSWEVEAQQLSKEGRSLTELASIGPYIAKMVEGWIQNPPVMSEPPEERKDFLTWQEARSILSTKPSWKTAYRGDLQMHTAWSDGSGSVQEMAEAAIQRGYSYIAITDHAKGLKIANGVDEDRLARQVEEIDALNTRYLEAGQQFTVLKSIELNLNPKGKGDLDESTLESLDLVVGCFHSALRKSDDQTARYLAALDNPFIHILGHPRGRIYNYRVGLKADWKTVFKRATDSGKAVEIDSYPDRQDLNVDLLREARKAGCMIAIDTDAHHPWQLAYVEFGLAAAIKAGIKAERIINFNDVTTLKTRLHR
jgi:histidinol phosphatase-like PHP family hydrolase